jgi:hypothetical protein
MAMVSLTDTPTQYSFYHHHSAALTEANENAGCYYWFSSDPALRFFEFFCGQIFPQQLSHAICFKEKNFV